MKRMGIFTSIFIVILAIFYLQPVFFPSSKKPVEKDQTSVVSNHTALNHEELSATGFSKYIDQESATLEKVLGQPTATEDYGLGYQLQIYRTEAYRYIEVNSVEGIIESIKVIGSAQEETAPFEIGMDMKDLAALTTIYPNFTFDYQEDFIEVELTEEDMNYRPLIAFDNESFAMLFFDQSSGQLFAVNYLSKKALMTLMPYQLVSGVALPYTHQEIDLTEENINHLRSQRMRYVLNLLRTLSDLLPYISEGSEQQDVENLMKAFSEQENQVFLSEERNQELQESVNSRLMMSSFLLTNHELNDFLNEENHSKDSGLLATNILDSTFAILNWFSDSYVQTRFAHPDVEILSIAFSKENVLVLLHTYDQEETEVSESQ